MDVEEGNPPEPRGLEGLRGETQSVASKAAGAEQRVILGLVIVALASLSIVPLISIGTRAAPPPAPATSPPAPTAITRSFAGAATVTDVVNDRTLRLSLDADGKSPLSGATVLVRITSDTLGGQTVRERGVSTGGRVSVTWQADTFSAADGSYLLSTILPVLGAVTPGPITTPGPLPGCETLPQVPFTYKRVPAPDLPFGYDIQIDVPAGVENRETVCLYEGLTIEADYALIEHTIRTLETVLKKTPEDYEFFRTWVKRLEHRESIRRAEASFGNNGWDTVYFTRFGLFEVTSYENELFYCMLNYAGRLIHEADQVRMGRDNPRIPIRDLLINSDEREIEYLRNWSSVRIVPVLIDARLREIENCRRGALRVCR